MVRFSLKGIIGCLLCAGILALCMSTPGQSRLNADDVAQKKAEIEKADELAKQLVKAMRQQSTLNEKFVNADSRTMDLVESLQQSIKMLGEHMRESVPTRDEVSKLVIAKFDASTSDGECTCGEKLADLKSKVASLECQCAATTSRPTSAAAASSYGTATPSAFSAFSGSNGGSTGMAKSYGSTGSGYGSTGTAPQSTPRESTTIDGPLITVVTTPSCSRCLSVYATVQSVYGSAGWLVDKESEDQRPGVSYPYYRVCVGSNCIELHCTPGQLDEQVKSQLVTWGVSFSDTSAKNRLRGERLASRQPVFPNARWNK